VNRDARHAAWERNRPSHVFPDESEGKTRIAAMELLVQAFDEVDDAVTLVLHWLAQCASPLLAALAALFGLVRPRRVMSNRCSATVQFETSG
jgi:hypothetical protein